MIHPTDDENSVENSREFLAWSQMIGRCRNPGHPEYMHFGGIGIGICPEWRTSFARFLLDMGRMPSIHCAITRENNAKNFSKDNCLWDYPASYMEHLQRETDRAIAATRFLSLDIERANATASSSRSVQNRIHPTPSPVSPGPIRSWIDVEARREGSQEGINIMPQSTPIPRCSWCPRCTIL